MAAGVLLPPPLPLLSDRSQQSQVGSTAGSAYTPQEAILRATNAQVNKMLVERVSAIERMSWGRPVVQKDGVKVCQNIVFLGPDLLHSSPHWGVGGFKNNKWSRCIESLL